MDSVLTSFHSLSLGATNSRQEFAPIKVTKNSSIVRDLFRSTRKYDEWDFVDFEKVCTYVELSPNSTEFVGLKSKFVKSLSILRTQVTEIKRVQNPFLYAQYELKTKHKRLLYGSVTERQLYHGTKSHSVDSICTKNFDWRRLGANGMRFSKFGRGVSFSPSSSYAKDYPRRCPERPRSMMVASVVEGGRCVGVSDMVIPPVPADTSVKPGDGNVVVKYFDNEFYPEYVMEYYTT